MKTVNPQDMLGMLKALADESRLSLLQRLNERECSVGELAELIELGEPTVSHHLARLREAGLVTLRMAGNQRFYRTNPTGLARFKRMAVHIESMPAPIQPKSVDDGWIAALGWPAEEQQVLREHTSGTRLTSLPAKQKKMNVILRWLATLFEPEKMYSEVEVNTLLKSAYEEDYISLRHDLIDFGYLRRERGGGKYWLAPVGTDTKE
jgi:hypothetical protein